MAAYQVGTCDFVDGILLVGLGVDGTVIADGIDFLAFPSNLGDSVALSLLELVDELVHDIDEDDLQDKTLARLLCCSMFFWRRRLKLPQSQTDTASQQQSHGRYCHPQNEQL